MIPYKHIRNVVVKGLKSYLNCPFIRFNQEGETPAYPYGGYTVLTDMLQNNGTYGEYTDGIARKLVKHSWSITFQSDNEEEAYLLACKAKEWLDYVGTTYLNDNNVIVQSTTSVMPRDNLLTTNYEYKRGFDVFFSCFDEIKSNRETGETIETITFNKDINV